MRVIYWVIMSFLLSTQIGAEPLPVITCDPWDEERALEATPGKLYTSRERPLLQILPFSFETEGSGPDEPDPGKGTPHVAVELDDGWLLGSNHGEWGGSLVHRSGEMEVTIIEDNIEDIYRLGGHFVVTAGLSHMTLNRGVIYLIHKSTPSGFGVLKLHALPGAPLRSWLQDSGDLYIEVQGGSEYILSSGYELRRVVCK